MSRLQLGLPFSWGGTRDALLGSNMAQPCREAHAGPCLWAHRAAIARSPPRQKRFHFAGLQTAPLGNDCLESNSVPGHGSL